MRRMGVLLAAVLLCGCTRTQRTREITAIIREEGSGTRAAFAEAFGLTDAEFDPDAVVTNSTSVVKLCVAGNPDAIGYLSAGALDDTVTAVDVDGIALTPQTLVDGSYPVMRTFYLTAPEAIAPQAVDFLQFIASDDGQAVTRAAGFVPSAFTAPSGDGVRNQRLVIAGSSSVAPLCEALREAYLTANPDAAIEIQISDSSTGAAALAAGVCDLAMLSRSPDAGEGTPYPIARDALAVIVHPASHVQSLSTAQIRSIFSGKAVRWDALFPENG